MKYDSRIIILDKQELIEMIKNNKCKNNIDSDKQLIRIIDIFYSRFSIKQLSMIKAKINYIVRTNKQYMQYRKYKDICLF
jgi:reverse gyrase